MLCFQIQREIPNFERVCGVGAAEFALWYKTETGKK